MIDAMTREPLKISGMGTARPFIMLPFSQLDELRQHLDQHQIRYTVGEDVISWNGGPETVFVDLGRGADAAAIQAMLDQVR